jgi:HEPN domain-containing protein
MSQSAKNTASATPLEWLNKADQDYIAARQLFLKNSLIEGAMFSTTAIEKYMKAVLCLARAEIPTGAKGHNLPELRRRAKRKGIVWKIRDDYLELLVKLYKERYPQSLPIGFKYAISRTELFCELDFTVNEIRKGFTIRSGTGPVETLLDRLKAKQDPDLLEKNCFFGSADRKSLFAEETFCIEVIVLPNGQPMRIEYKALGIRDDGNFNRGPKLNRPAPSSFRL